MPRPAAPFTPKTNTHLLPGDWWAVPLRDGRFAAGRVLARQAFGPSDRVGLTVALLDWLGHEPPTEQDIAGRPVLVWGLSRVDAITKTGGEVLGNRPLADDNIKAPVLTQAVGEKTSVWGWRTIVNRAEAHFLGQDEKPFATSQSPAADVLHPAIPSRVVTAGGVSERLTRWVLRNFDARSSERVLETLAALPKHVAPWDGPPRERIQAALVLRTGGDWHRFEAMVRLAEQDWRDALVAGELADQGWPDRLDAELD